MKIFCVIPAYNEEKTILKVIDGVKRYVKNIVVVDDGSTDNTRVIARKNGVKAIRHIINRGQGAALITGNQYAISQGADIIVHFDADGQFSASDIEKIILPLKDKRAQIVFGSRFLGGDSQIPKLKKYIILPLAHAINKILAGRSLTDPQSGFRAMNREVAENLKIENDGAAHCSEIIHKALKSGYRFCEVPITVKYFRFGQSVLGGKGRGMGGVRIIKDLLVTKLLN